jgi:hypothetical protein
MSKPIDRFFKTKPCLHFSTCTKQNCGYAHSLEELRDPMCAFDDDCNKKGCMFKHPKETKEEYRERVGFIAPSFEKPTIDIETISTTSDIPDLPPFVLDKNEPMSHVIASMAVIMRRNIKWV